MTHSSQEIIMAWINDAKAKRRRTARVAAGVILTATLAFGTFTGDANAEGRGREHWDRGNHREWRGGYYRAPPVIYGSPYYAPYYAPPLIYGPPGIGLNFNIR
jgi:hypothetical protein